MRDEFIEFYGKNKVSPVRQDISDLKKHFDRRESLYRQLGLLPAFFKNKKVLEIGPGSGHNAVYIASLEPEIYHLAEGNLTGVEQMQDLFMQFDFIDERVTVFPTRYEDFKPEGLYDIVICEGMLPGLMDPLGALEHISKFVNKHGVLIITCIDPVSIVAESFRHLIGQLLIWDCKDFDEMVKKLLPLFSPHLNTLQGMSRSHEDWIIDNIINPAGIGETLSIAEAICELYDKFDIYGSSPHFFRDWRWYKAIYGNSMSFNDLAINQYWEQVHSFIDYRRNFSDRSKEENLQLYKACDLARRKIRKLHDERDLLLLPEIIFELNNIIGQIQTFSEELSVPFQEINTILSNNIVFPDTINSYVEFVSLFGRGQQYISFTRKSD